MIHEVLWTLRYTRRWLRRRTASWYRALAQWRRFWQSYRRYRRLAPLDRWPSLVYLYPCLGDDTAETAIEPIYFFQGTWAFKSIVDRRPKAHVDVGSHHTFVALLSLVVPVTAVDIRPFSVPLDTLSFRKGTILDLPFADASIPSVSSLCVVEHIGLGRYGDRIDPWGTEKAIAELKRIVAPGGDLYLSVPIDDENRTYFNAHRAFREQDLLHLFEPFRMSDRRYIYGKNFGEHVRAGFGTGCYHLRRPQ